MAFENQREPEPVFSPEQHTYVTAAKSLPVGFYAYVRLHHGVSEQKFQLVVFERFMKQTEGTAVLRLFVFGRTGVERFVDGNCVNMLGHDGPPFVFIFIITACRGKFNIFSDTFFLTNSLQICYLCEGALNFR